MRYGILVFATLIIMTSGVADAQRYGRGSYNDGGGYRASTVGESRANGMSNIIQSRAWANKTNSEAAINLTEVRSKQLDNRKKTADTYFSMRNMNREQRFGTTEDKAAHRAKNQELYARYARAGNPKRPNAQQLDPITGEIKWPFSLMPEKFEPYREELQKLFTQRSKQGGVVNYDEFQQAKKTTDQMMTALKDGIKDIEPSDYLSAKQFINQLAYEVKHSS